jgi:hypothetical protein
LRDAWATLARNLVAACYINNVDDKVGKLTRVVCSEIVTARLDEEQVRVELMVEVGQGE